MKIIFREKEQRVQLSELDSIAQIQASQIESLQEQKFSLEQKVQLANGAARDMAGEVAVQVKEKEKAQQESAGLSRKLRRSRALRWVFGGIGIALGFVLGHGI